MYETWQNFHQKSQIDKVLSILCAVFQVLFLNNCSIIFKILNMWDKWKNWYQLIPLYLYAPVHENHLPAAAIAANYNPWRFGNGPIQAQHQGSRQQDPGV